MLNTSILRRLAMPVMATTLWFTACDTQGTITVAVDRQQVQERVSEQFPISNAEGFTQISLAEPEVILTDGSDRIGVAVRLSAQLPLFGPVRGGATVSGMLSYRQDGRAFFFTEPRLDALEIEGISTGFLDTARNAVEAAAHVALAELPVYTLARRTYREVAAEHVLQNVWVSDGILYLELGLP